MYKKAGIIVGIAVIVATLIIIGLTSIKKEPKQEKQPTQTQKVVQTATPAPAATGNSDRIGSMLVISELPTPTVTKEVGVVQQKNIVLLDSELYYTVSLLVGVDNLSLNYMVSKSGYEAVSVGDKCEVSLAKYQTTNNKTFYMIQGLDLIK